METERYCDTLEALQPNKAIRAIHHAWLQLTALTEHVDCEPYDNGPAIDALAECLKQAGHIGFTS